MTPNILENISTWLVDWSLVTMGNTTPPRDPNDENDEDDEDAEDDKDDKDDDEDDENDENDDTRGRTSRWPTAIKTRRSVYSATAFPAGEILSALSRPSRF